MYVFVIPARDEAATISRVLNSVRTRAESCRLDFDVVVSDDGSVDQTAELARRAGAHVVSSRGEGLAAAFRLGVGAAVDRGAEYIIHVDADGQYDLDDLPALLAASGPRRLVVGDRLHRRPAEMSDLRYQWNGHLSDLVARLASMPVADSQSGFRIFHRDLATSVRISSSYTYTQEQIVRAAVGGTEVVQPPISFGPRLDGRSRLMSSGLDYLWRVFRDLSAVAAELGIDPEGSSMATADRPG